ncbi:hypothetical protein [Nocardia pseudobrasiliensis]|uniref:Uncharacterized protein n=1 Tax=Nocardia pseudobrasiliensis TaxID=45979 RepID=A0A370ID37_9NOCA|nr:hypothetical protein [Nocardia pseudobrasiliensis]RDI68021.1 hypothetical protein DFR76_102422 [Nocardia pseudobrasiliensis]
MGSGPGEILYVDKSACRALADGLGTAGQQLRILGRGGAISDSLGGGLAGAKTPDACHVAARAADLAMGAVGTALLEMGGVVVGAIAGFQERDIAGALGIDSGAQR